MYVHIHTYIYIYIHIIGALRDLGASIFPGSRAPEPTPAGLRTDRARRQKKEIIYDKLHDMKNNQLLTQEK